MEFFADTYLDLPTCTKALETFFRNLTYSNFELVGVPRMAQEENDCWIPHTLTLFWLKSILNRWLDQRRISYQSKSVTLSVGLVHFQVLIAYIIPDHLFKAGLHLGCYTQTSMDQTSQACWSYSNVVWHYLQQLSWNGDQVPIYSHFELSQPLAMQWLEGTWSLPLGSNAFEAPSFDVPDLSDYETLIASSTMSNSADQPNPRQWSMHVVQSMQSAVKLSLTYHRVDISSGRFFSMSGYINASNLIFFVILSTLISLSSSPCSESFFGLDTNSLFFDLCINCVLGRSTSVFLSSTQCLDKQTQNSPYLNLGVLCSAALYPHGASTREYPEIGSKVIWKW